MAHYNIHFRLSVFFSRGPPPPLQIPRIITSTLDKGGTTVGHFAVDPPCLQKKLFPREREVALCEQGVSYGATCKSMIGVSLTPL